MEEYKIIEGFENYSVSNFGNVKNNKTGRILKQALKRDGYYGVVLSKNGKVKDFKVHRLVALTLIPNPKNKPQVDHINNIRTDNNINNLRWATHQENQFNMGMFATNTSGIKGVVWAKDRNKWLARIKIDGILISLGYFNTIEEAQKKRINAANAMFGQYTNSCEKE